MPLFLLYLSDKVVNCLHIAPLPNLTFFIFELSLYELHSYISCLERLVFPFLWNVISFGPQVSGISITSFSPAFDSTEVN